jgi:tRNA pseudouridine38-40 synthase
VRNIKLTIEYDGTAYHGWQIQANGITIQQTIEEALVRIIGEERNVLGSGRTDAGVHAIAQVASFGMENQIECGRLLTGLNALLPEDIAISDCREMPPGFDAQRSSLEKTYQYRIFNRNSRSALERNRSWHLGYKFDLSLMKYALAVLEGEHDFASFRAANSCAKTTVRCISSIELQRQGDFLNFEVTANGFLMFMVRNIVGTMVEIGRGRFAPDSMQEILDACDRTVAGPTAPARGLYLKKVNYPPEDPG